MGDPAYSGSKALYAYLKLDGIIGTTTKKALQLWLQKKCKTYPASYLIDGVWGYYTTLALQKQLRKLGYYTKAYLLDGDMGQASYDALFDLIKYVTGSTGGYVYNQTNNWLQYKAPRVQFQRMLNDPYCRNVSA